MTNKLAERLTGSREDDFLVQFFRRWSAFGGGPEEDIMVTFGISKQEYEDRLYDLACSNRVRRFPPEVKELILTYCSSRPRHRHHGGPRHAADVPIASSFRESPGPRAVT